MKKKPTQQIWVKTLGVFAFLVIIAPFPLRSNPIFRKDLAPSKDLWAQFQGLSMKERQKLWQESASLNRWAWQWRLAWVKSCATLKDSFCSSLLSEALKDSAMVVRAAAATAVGSFYSTESSDKASRLLKDAYLNPSNYRNNKPLWVQRRILSALYQLGGAASQVGQDLAVQHPVTREYWQKISKF